MAPPRSLTWTSARILPSRRSRRPSTSPRPRSSSCFHTRRAARPGPTASPRSRSGTKGTVKSGGSVKLKSGETATIDTIPVGTTYTVKESEANADGYKTTVTGETGTIKRTVKAEADFTNHKDATPTPNKTVSPTPKTTTSTPTTPSDRTRGQRSLTSVKTGDAMKLGLTLAVAAAAAIGLCVYASRKKKEASAAEAKTKETKEGGNQE